MPLGEGYIGQDFAIRAYWTPAGLSGPALVRWIVLRTAVTPVVYDRAVLWVRPAQNTGEPAVPAQLQSGAVQSGRFASRCRIGL